MAAPSRPPPSLVDPGAEAALLGTFMRDPHRLDDRRVHRSLFASPPHLLVFDALRAAHDHGELAGDLLTASAALEANPQIPLPRSFSADAFDAADLALPDALLTHVAKLARRRQLRSLSLGLAAVAEHPHPDDDSETLATIAARTAELASNGAAPHPWLSIADSPTTAVSWLWSRRIPHGTLSLLDGDPGLGKTALALELAARVSIGFALPDDPEPPWPPAGVVLVNAEDSIATTIRPRLEAAGADLTRIVAFDLNHIPILPDGLPLLREALLDTHASLLIIDPVLAVLSASIDAYRDHDVRRFLHPLAALAEETNVAVLLVRHLTKQSGPKALYRGGGAIAFSGAARSVLLVAPDPDAPDSTRVLAPIKNNLSPMASALSFTLEPTPSSFRIAFTGPSQLRADQLVAPPHDDDDPDAVSFAVSFLRDLLANGPVESSLADKRRRQLSISDYAWKRARARLRISAVKEGFSGGWAITLPLTPS